jgi:hypothetical protein
VAMMPVRWARGIAARAQQGAEWDAGRPQASVHTTIGSLPTPLARPDASLMNSADSRLVASSVKRCGPNRLSVCQLVDQREFATESTPHGQTNWWCLCRATDFCEHSQIDPN